MNSLEQAGSNALLMLDLIPRWERSLEREGYRERGIKRYKDNMLDFVRTHGPSMAIDDFTPRAVIIDQDVLTERGCSGGTKCNRLTALRSFAKFCVFEDLLAEDPTTKVRWPKRQDPQVRHLRMREVRKIQRVLAEPWRSTAYGRFLWLRLRLAIYLMQYAGLRISEVAVLLWKNIDTDAKARVIHIIDSKHGRNRDIKIHRVLLAELERVPEQERYGPVIKQKSSNPKKDGLPLGPKSLAHLFESGRELSRLLIAHNDDGSVRTPEEAEAALERARRGEEIDAVGPHQFRRFFATMLKRKRVDLDDIRKILGHRHLNTTQRYLDGGPDDDDDEGEIVIDRLPVDW